MGMWSGEKNQYVQQIQNVSLDFGSDERWSTSNINPFTSFTNAAKLLGAIRIFIVLQLLWLYYFSKHFVFTSIQLSKQV